jgi:hypothetical protein
MLSLEPAQLERQRRGARAKDENYAKKELRPTQSVNHRLYFVDSPGPLD